MDFDMKMVGESWIFSLKNKLLCQLEEEGWNLGKDVYHRMEKHPSVYF